MKYLVLGSKGQIGGSLTPYLRNEGHEVIEFDIRDGNEYDLRISSKKLIKSMHECDFVFFLAWDVGGSIYLERYQDTYEFIMNNVKIIDIVFECLNETKKPFIFASSQMANMSYSSYGVTKSIGERLARSLNGVTVKFWNVYGYETDPEKTHVITDFINKAMNTYCIDMRTDGSESRQMLYADDCSECLYNLSLQYDSLPRDKEYHVTSFEWITIHEIAEIVARRFPGTTVVRAKSKDLIQKDLRNEPDPWILNFWKPKTSIRSGIILVADQMYIHKGRKSSVQILNHSV